VNSGAIKSPGQSLVGAASDWTLSFSVCRLDVELRPHHGTSRRYSHSTPEASGIFFDVRYPPALLRRRPRPPRDILSLVPSPAPLGAPVALRLRGRGEMRIYESVLRGRRHFFHVRPWFGEQDADAFTVEFPREFL